MTPIEQDDTMTEAPRKHRNDHPWAGICVAPGCTYGHSVLSREERDALARSWLAAGFAIVRSEELAGLRAIEEAARDYAPEREHSWRCEYRTAEAGWKAGGPPVIRCKCGYDALSAALEKGAPRHDQTDHDCKGGVQGDTFPF